MINEFQEILDIIQRPWVETPRERLHELATFCKDNLNSENAAELFLSVSDQSKESILTMTLVGILATLNHKQT